MDIETIIKENNIKPGSLVKFLNDSKEYTVRNISTDRKGLFVLLNDSKVYYKPINKLIEIERKPIKENQMNNNIVFTENKSIEEMQKELAELEAALQSRYDDYNDDNFWADLSPQAKKLWKTKTITLEDEIQKLKKRIKRTSSLKENNDNQDLENTPTLEAIAAKWAAEYYDIENLLPILQKKLEKGIAIELKNTKDEDIAKKNVLNHLMENPNYYDELDSRSSIEKDNNEMRTKNGSNNIEEKIDLKSQLFAIIEQLEALLVNTEIKIEEEHRQNINIALNKLKEVRNNYENAIDTFINTQKEMLTDNDIEVVYESILEKFCEEILKEKSDYLTKEKQTEEDLIITEEMVSTLGYHTTNSSETYKLNDNNTVYVIVLDYENIYDLTPSGPVLDSKILSNINIDDNTLSPQNFINNKLFNKVLQKLNCTI